MPLESSLAASLLGRWESFYVIIGSSAAALTGLQFIVVTLVADTGRRTTGHEINAFATPSIVHYCVALSVSALLSAPWTGLTGVDVALGAIGLFGVGYTALVFRRARRQRGYKPVLEDWVWHVIVPLAAYGAVVWAAFTLREQVTRSLFVVAGAMLLLVLTGIHNAWDTVTFLMVDMSGENTANTGDARPAQVKRRGNHKRGRH